MKNIISVGYEIPGYSDLLHSFNSNISLSDGDIIIFCPDFKYVYHSTENFEGKPLYSDDSSFKVKENSNHWKRELIYALNAGKTVFVFLVAKEDIAVFSHKDYSGTGRSRVTTNYLSSYDNYQWMFLNDFRINSVKGTKIQKPSNPLFISYYNAFNKELSYEAVIQIEGVKPIFKTPSGERMLGCHVKYKNGNLILLPYLSYDYANFVEVDKKDKEIWSKKPIAWGDKLVSILVEIDKNINLTTPGTPPPKWVSEKTFLLDKEIKITKDINSIEEKISKLNKKIDELRVNLQEEKIIKGLLFETGKPLEIAVTKALQILGYKAKGYNDGNLELDQVIIAPDGRRYIGECEGKDNSSIDITKFRQLADAINEDFEKEEISEEATGILFGNAYRLLPLSERKDFFTKKCIDAARRRNYGLIKTPDLFLVAKYLLKSNDLEYKKKCQESITKGLGDIITFPKMLKK